MAVKRVTKRYEINSIVGQEIRLGYAGENNVRCVEIDVNEWLNDYDAELFVLFVVPPKDTCDQQHHKGYLADVTYEDGIISWVITSRDTISHGTGFVEVIMYGTDGAILQSPAIRTKVMPSISHGSDVSDEEMDMNQAWIDQMADLAMDAQEAAKRAEDVLESVEQIAGGSVLPTGGEAGQILAKASDDNFDAEWRDVSELNIGRINGGDSFG